jgi:hypothetical protein
MVIMQDDFVHRTRPDQQRVRRIGGALIAMAAAFDDQPQIVLACEIDGGNHVSGASDSHSVNARSGHPSIYPAGGLGRAGLIANIVGILQALYYLLARCAVRPVRTRSERGLYSDQLPSDILVELLPAFLGRP